MHACFGHRARQLHHLQKYNSGITSAALVTHDETKEMEVVVWTHCGCEYRFAVDNPALADRIITGLAS